MLQKIKSFVVIAVTVLGFSAPALVPASAFATCNNIQTYINHGINQATGTTQDCAASAQTDFSHIASEVVNIFSIIVGIVAVIMIIWGGFKYITSGGESGSVSGAKNTLIYAIVGLIIVALAQFIVHFVLGTASNAVQ